MKKAKLKEKNQILVLLFFVFSISLFSGNLKAEEWRPEFTLAVQKSFGQQIMEEFIPNTSPSITLSEREFSVETLSQNKDNLKSDFPKRLKFESTPKWKKFSKGALFGALIGGASLGIAGLLSGDDEPGFFAYTAGQKAYVGAYAGALIGSVIGGLIGIFSKS